MALSDLNNTYYELFGDLYRNRSLLTVNQYDIMAKVLKQQYIEDLDICLMERALDIGKRVFELKFQSRMYIPRRCFFVYNKVAKRLLKQYKLEFLNELKRLEMQVKKEASNVNLAEESSELTAMESTALTVAGEHTVVPTGESATDETNV